MENPIKMDDFGGISPYFWKHPNAFTAFWKQLGIMPTNFNMRGVTSQTCIMEEHTSDATPPKK